MGKKIEWDDSSNLGPDVDGDVLVEFRDGTTAIGPVDWFDWEVFGDDPSDIIFYTVLDDD